MRLKIILTLLSIIGLTSSCNETVDGSVYVDFWYYNTTNEVISINAFIDDFVENYAILANDSLFIETEMMFGSANPIVVADSVKIKYCCKHSCLFKREDASPNNPIDLSNYKYKKLGKDHHQHKFYFTQE